MNCLFLIVTILGIILLPAGLIRKAAADGQVVLSPTDDTYVDFNNMNSNYGSLGYLNVSCWQQPGPLPARNWRDSWLKFDLSSIPDGVTADSAVLNLSVDVVTENYVIWAISCTNNTWSESTLTFMNAPTGDLNYTILEAVEVTNSTRSYVWHVTSLVNQAVNEGPKLVTIVLTVPYFNSLDSFVSFYSKEHGSEFSPTLRVHWGGTPHPGIGGIRLEPKTSTNHVGTMHTVRAFVTGAGETPVPVPDVTVDFTITSGPNVGRTLQATTNQDGVAEFSWTSEVSGTDIVNGTIRGETFSDTASKTWESGIGGIRLEPKTATNHVGTNHTLFAFVTNKDGVPMPYVHVNFTIVSGPNAGRSMLGLSNPNGVAAFSWSSEVSGTDIVNATIAGETVFDTASKTWQSGFFDPIMGIINRIPIGVIVGTALLAIALVGSYAVLRWKRKTH